MRIISGKARGTKLYTLEGIQTRPTLDKVKESIFNILQFEIKECVFLDLFAGSGAVGLEAASRGAKRVILCDESKEANQIIKKNIEKTHLENQVELYQMSSEKLLKNKINKKIDIIYIDPPYKTDLVYKSIEIIIGKEILANNGIMIIETDEEERIKREIGKFEKQIEIYDTRKYGRAHLIFVRLKDKEKRKG